MLLVLLLLLLLLLLLFLESTIPTDVEQATGLEKKEIDALMAGVEVNIKHLPSLPTVQFLS